MLSKNFAGLFKTSFSLATRQSNPIKRLLISPSIHQPLCMQFAVYDHFNKKRIPSISPRHFSSGTAMSEMESAFAGDVYN